MALQFWPIASVKGDPTKIPGNILAALIQVAGVQNPGACRAAAVIAGSKRGSKEDYLYLKAASQFREHHAEEKLVELIKQQWNGEFDYMYIDIEPCHDKKYRGHDCRAFLEKAFPAIDATIVWVYAQETYEKGDTHRLKKRDAMGTVTAGGFSPPVVALGRNREPFKAYRRLLTKQAKSRDIPLLPLNQAVVQPPPGEEDDRSIVLPSPAKRRKPDAPASAAHQLVNGFGRPPAQKPILGVDSRHMQYSDLRESANNSSSAQPNAPGPSPIGSTNAAIQHHQFKFAMGLPHPDGPPPGVSQSLTDDTDLRVKAQNAASASNSSSAMQQ